MNYIPLFIFILVSQVWCQSKDEIVVLNEMIDENLPQIREAVKQYGFDPMRLPNIMSTVYAKIAFWNESINMNLTNGVLSGASSLERAGNFYLSFAERTIRVHARVHFEELRGKFNFSYDTTLYSDKGSMITTIKNVTARIIIDYKLYEILVANPRIKIENFGDVDVSMTSDALLSPVTNIIANYAIPSYRKDILDVAEKTALQVAEKVLIKVNKKLPQFIADVLANIIEGALTGNLSQSIQNYYDKKYGKNRNKKLI